MISPNVRLEDLIEFVKQSALLKITPLQNVSQYKQFLRFEDQIRGLPGVHLCIQDEGVDEVWLSLDRLRESKPPIPESQLLAVWIDLPNTPYKEPTLKPHVDKNKLINLGALPIPYTDDTVKTETQSEIITLDNYPDKETVKIQLKSYMEVVWKEWATKEKEIRKSISFYSDLFMLSQQLQGNLIDSQLELIWGIGIGIQNIEKGTLTYPLLTQVVEISLNQKTMSLEIRPRSSEPRLEVDVYAAMDNPGVANLVAAGKQFFKITGGMLNPFESSSFEGLLRSAATFLDASGIYWPNQTTSDDRSLPKASDNLAVTDTWVLFARPRTNSLFVQDLERFEKELTSGENVDLPPAVAALVTEPSTINEDVALPTFRGLSIVNGSDDYSSGPTQELYFPMPYNDEQIQIVQMLETHDGVVVQGPPGTGKTHTIANVICHYLAQGKRVLVTSMKDPALAVLQEKLPESIRPLAISLLTSEIEGMKQFEFAINKIATEVSSIDRIAYKREIEQIDIGIDALHGQISKTDKEIANWAKKNLNKIRIDDEELSPVEAAEEVTNNRQEVAWFPDELTIEEKYRPQFSNSEISALRNARLILGQDLAYLGKKIPQISEFPETVKLLQAHNDLSRLSELRSQESNGLIPPLANTAPDTIKAAMAASAQVANLRLLLQDIENAQHGWINSIKQYIQRSPQNEILDLFLALKDEIINTLNARKQFLSRPVNVPDDLDTNIEIVEAIANQVKGKKPFGLAGLFGKSEQKRLLDSIVVVNSRPNSPSDWEHVLQFMQFQQKSRELLIRWNKLADEISLPRYEIKPNNLLDAGHTINVYDKIAKSLIEEKNLSIVMRSLIPSWQKHSETSLTRSLLEEAESILTHHLTRHRLAETWIVKESFLGSLDGCEGEITNQLKSFLNEKLGNPTVTDTELQTKWSALMEELRRIHDLVPHLRTVAEITQLVEYSGAVKWATMLRIIPRTEASDALLPENWQEIWRLRRLISFIDSIDGRKELKRLSGLRSEMESELAKFYQDAVTKRTWLKLSENATHDVRAALEAYRAAIKKIGKGTGIRAGRYRQDARFAAERANQAIPCWIMPHYRIYESLPARIGCFDLVVIDEASQSDLTALPAILRSQKILIVGDDKQVSPEGVGLEEEKVRNLMTRFLANQVDIYRPQMSPDRSIYDLFKVVFAKSAVMLREHFRCVAPIIEYSKREFYNHELKPLRLPKSSERIDPPLVDVYIRDGYRSKDVNHPEARFIVDEIKCIAENPLLTGRSIGVVSLIGNEQALKIMQMLSEEIGEKIITQARITCGDARTFQGKERDIIFLSMVASPKQAHAQTQDMIAQRFNVAASRARDRMYLVRSIQLEDLSPADRLRANLIQHFQAPFNQSEEEIIDLRKQCESPFEREIFDFLVERGYRVIPQVPVGAYRIDMVVEGDNDSRLAIECDGDRFHGPDQWNSDMRRQRILERAGWRFWRCFASTFVLQREDVLQDLLETLENYGVAPTGSSIPVKSTHVEYREVTAFPCRQEGSERDLQDSVNTEII